MALYEPHQSGKSSIANQKLIEQQYNQAEAEVNKWHQCAVIALKKGREDLAREALIRKHDYSKTAATLKTQIEQLTAIASSFQNNAANQALEKNPQETLEKAIIDTREAVKIAVGSFESIQQQYSKARKEANNYKQQAQIALQKDDENLAFQPLIGKIVQSQVSTALKVQLEQQVATVELLKRNLIALEKVKEMLELQAIAERDRQWNDNVAVIEAELFQQTSQQTAVSDSVLDVEWK